MTPRVKRSESNRAHLVVVEQQIQIMDVQLKNLHELNVLPCHYGPRPTN